MNKEIKFQNSGNKGKAYLGELDSPLAQMTISITPNSLWIIDHTEVDERLKGQGIGKNLLIKVVQQARELNIKILPLCPYAKHAFEKYESIQDVLK
ncbi:GNAT family N-acetyltransferase [Marivirga harenae]|uniref:GNAT family N-acetyltransferase n=1 Tax=Marivirga harenae TaxID=2010992 RepID=UPI0026DF7284|nr:GNAT family N-acetyltransferase [Marivirga harenae]WKV10799.1 GNAT family N-acetyltransferase [Marivirga harenae]|tara:strand:- start:63009 stop:63296 length:288 start_codon:yes stop_codon:yes gene_type:complete